MELLYFLRFYRIVSWIWCPCWLFRSTLRHYYVVTGSRGLFVLRLCLIPVFTILPPYVFVSLLSLSCLYSAQSFALFVLFYWTQSLNIILLPPENLSTERQYMASFDGVILYLRNIHLSHYGAYIFPIQGLTFPYQCYEPLYHRKRNNMIHSTYLYVVVSWTRIFYVPLLALLHLEITPYPRMLVMTVYVYLGLVSLPWFTTV